MTSSDSGDNPSPARTTPPCRRPTSRTAGSRAARTVRRRATARTARLRPSRSSPTGSRSTGSRSTASPSTAAADQPPYGQQSYGVAPGYGYAGQPVNHPQVTTAMVLSLVGLVGIAVCGGITLVLSPFAWRMGARAVRDRREPGDVRRP